MRASPSEPRLPADEFPKASSKDDEFSRRSIEEHWLAGYRDTVHALRHPDVLPVRCRKSHLQ